MNMSKNDKVSIAIAPASGVAGTTDIEGVTLDMQGFEGVLMVVAFGAITGSAVTSIKAQQGAESDLSDAADLVGTGQTVADDDDEQVFYIDVFRPMKRYVRLYVDRATQNAVVASAIYIQYGIQSARKAPVTHGTGVSGELHVSPAEGTA